MAELKQFLDKDGTAVVATHIKTVDAKIDAMSLNTLIIYFDSSYIGGTYSISGGSEEYSGTIDNNSMEFALLSHETDYHIKISRSGEDDFDTTVSTGKYWNHYVVDMNSKDDGGGDNPNPVPGDTLDDTDWETISRIAKAGEASAYWSVGDVKGVELDTYVNSSYPISGTYYAFIIGFDHNSDLEGKNTIHFQFAKLEDGTDVAFRNASMNSTNTNVGGWEACSMRTTTLPNLFESLPDDLQNVILDTTKYTDNVGNGTGSVASNVTPTTDKLFLLSQYEVFASSSNTYESDYQQQYAYYAAGNSTIKYHHSAATTACYWWLRSPDASAATGFRYVTSSGGSGYLGASGAYGVSAAFGI